MAQQSLTYDDEPTCRWCCDGIATTTLYATPTCIACAAGSAKDRVQRWLAAVARRIKGKQGT